MVDKASLEERQRYMDGSIFRVRVHDFLTYDDAEFFPGPRLNVVLGPNGTGKSSIVCALCIGLGGHTKLLGRADNPKDFIRHGKEHAWTEVGDVIVDLNANMLGNVVIRHDITRENSTWKMNGTSCSLKQVKALTSSSFIQIDNLCQFLPQDKVGEFSQMNSQQLLRATENAILDPGMADVHDRIIELQKNQLQIVQKLEETRESLDAKKRDMEQLEREVNRLTDHKRIQEETVVMEKKMLWLQTERAINRVEEFKMAKKQLKEEMMERKAREITPIEEYKKSLLVNLEDIHAESDNLKKATANVERALRNTKDKITKVQDDANIVVGQLEQHHEGYQQKKEKLEKLRDQRQGLIEEIHNYPDKDEVMNEKNEVEEALRKADEDYNTTNNSFSRQSRVYQSTDRELEMLKQRIDRLSNQAHQREENLKQNASASMAALNWIRMNENQFRRPVIGPIALEINTTDASQAAMLETVVPDWVLKAFVVQCDEDYQTLNARFNDQRGGGGSLGNGGIGVILVTTKHLARRLFTPEELARVKAEFGITGYLDETLSALPEVLAALQSYANIDEVLVGGSITDAAVNRGVDVFSALAASAGKSVRFVTREKLYMVNVSRYGKRQVTTQVSDIRRAKYLNATGDNYDQLQLVKNQYQDMAATQAELGKAISELKLHERKLKESRHALSTRRVEIRDLLKSMNNSSSRLLRYDDNIRDLEEVLSHDTTSVENALKTKLKKITMQHVDLLVTGQAQANDLFAAMVVQGQAETQHAIMDGQVKRIDAILRQLAAKLSTLKAHFEQAKRELTEAAKEAAHLKKQAQREAPLDDALEAAFQRLDLPDDVEALRSRIEGHRAATEHFQGDLSAFERYERIQRDVNAEQARWDSMQTDWEKEKRELDVIKDPWHKKLKELVSRIDASFQDFFKDIGCHGEVLLLDDSEDVAKWGIERRAKFREHSELRTLNAFEQSGGEKSVGTIMYLMAIQSLTKCPFRVVDEINQGMDATNERKVFRRITKSSCGAFLPQYFLITPKLITGLEYHEDTSVMVIYNGSNSVQQADWDLDGILKLGGESCVTSKKRARVH